MSLDLTAFDAALKAHYGPQQLAEISFKSRPLLSRIPKYSKLTGKSYSQPTKFAASHNRAAQFTAGRRSASGAASTTSAALAEFQVTQTKKNYGFAFLDRETILSAADDRGAFARATTTEVDAAIEAMSDDIHGSLYGSGVGERGEIAAGGVSGAVITLSDPNDIVKFERGMVLRATSGSTVTNALRTEFNRSIVGIDRSAGTITLDTAITGMAAGDFLFAHGDRIEGAITAVSQYQKIAGLAGWLPSVAPGSALWFGVDRTQDTDKLGGVRVDGSGMSYEEACITAGVEVGRLGGMGECLFANPTDVRNIVFEMGSKVERNPDQSNQQFGVSTLRMLSGYSSVEVIPDHQCPVGTGYLLTMDTWRLLSKSELIHIDQDDGNRMLRQADADGFELRLKSYAELMCSAPGRNAAITFPTV